MIRRKWNNELLSSVTWSFWRHFLLQLLDSGMISWKSGKNLEKCMVFFLIRTSWSAGKIFILAWLLHHLDNQLNCLITGLGCKGGLMLFLEKLFTKFQWEFFERNTQVLRLTHKCSIHLFVDCNQSVGLHMFYLSIPLEWFQIFLGHTSAYIFIPFKTSWKFFISKKILEFDVEVTNTGLFRVCYIERN